MDFNSQDSQEIMKKFKSIISSRLDKLYNEKGSDGELYAYSIAVSNQKKEKAKSQPEKPMEDNKLREMVKAALSNPKAADLNHDNKLSDYEKKRGAAIEKSMAKKDVKEDLDLGHEDDEPHMIKAELAQIGKYAMELYKMVDQFEGPQEVDFPAWWQSKITTAKNMLSSAKHYLEFELEEPKIDAMVDVASEEGAIDEMSKSQIKKRGEIYDALKAKGMSDEKAGKIATSTAMKKKIKEAILAKLKNK